MELSLNKANKYLQKMSGNLRNDSNARAFDGRMSLTVNVSDEPSKLFSKVLAERSEFEKDSSNTLSFAFDFYQLKQIIFKANADSGINNILNEIEYLKFKRSLCNSLIRMNTLTQNQIVEIPKSEEDVAYIQKKLAETDTASRNVTLFFPDINSIKEELKEVTRKLNVLEDKKIEFNQKKINIEFSEYTKEFLGI
jgi:hypothetical protein